MDLFYFKSKIPIINCLIYNLYFIYTIKQTNKNFILIREMSVNHYLQV